MKSRKFTVLAGIALAFLLVLGTNSNIAAQGRGGGGRPSGNPGNSGGSGNTGRGNSGVDRGINTSSDRSNGRSDRGRDTASDRSNGRSDDGMERARSGRDNATERNMPKDNELNRYQGIARKLNTTPENLRAQYQAAQAANPDLKFGQFVAANMVADNLGSRFPNVTSAAILSGLQNGDSIGKTLQNLGVSSDEAKQIEKRAKREMKDGKKQN